MGQTLGCIQVDQSTVAVKEHFGKFDDIMEPGCHCLPWCVGYQVAGTLTLRVQQLDVRCETKTKVCQNCVHITVFIFLCIGVFTCLLALKDFVLLFTTTGCGNDHDLILLA